MTEIPRIDPAELRAELARRRWTRRKLAEATGLSRSLVQIVCDGYRPSKRATALILDALGPSGAARVTVQEVASPL